MRQNWITVNEKLCWILLSYQHLPLERKTLSAETDLCIPTAWLVSLLSPGGWEACISSMSTGGLYPAPTPVERIPTGLFNQMNSEPVVNGNVYLVPFFNRLVQSSGLIQGTGLVPSNGFIQNTSLTGNFTPVIMETTAQTPPMVR